MTRFRLHSTLRALLLRLFGALCIGCCVLCAWTLLARGLRFERVDAIGFVHRSSKKAFEYSISLGQDGLWIGRMRADFPGDDLATGYFYARYRQADAMQRLLLIQRNRRYHFLGVVVLHANPGLTPFGGTGILIPAWLLAPLLAGPPALWLILSRGPWLRAKRRAAGLCAACGYDVRASPERCPECGQPVLPADHVHGRVLTAANAATTAPTSH